VTRRRSPTRPWSRRSRSGPNPRSRQLRSSPQVVSVRDRPDLVEPARTLTQDTLREYNNHGDVLNRYWGRLAEERSDFQFHVVDGDEILARAHSIPLRWDGTVEDLPAGIDGAIARGFDERDPNVLCALLIAVPPAAQRRGVSRLALGGMTDIARAQGLGALIAPVRPSLKERYPLAPIDRYAAWRRGDGLLFDPWLRTHERLGADVLKPEPHSLRITGAVGEWEGWVGLDFPESGDYVFPGGLAPLEIDREADEGRYWEPNVWMRHAV
jgi:GNAT superfamily N-acetyltransferase